MRKLSLFIILNLIITTSFASSNNKEHVVWDRVPISFVVPVGAERIISFPDRVVLKSLDDDLTSDKLKILNNQGSLYIKAKKEFNPIRVAVSLQKTGEVILVDIASKPNVNSRPLEVILKEELDENKQADNEASQDYISLIRQAVQELYASQRLIASSQNIKRAPMYTEKSISLFWDLPLISMPIASWSSNNYYITAVILKNNSRKDLTISLDYIKGDWVAASLYPSDLLTKRDSKNDRTTLFLVSKTPFHKAYLANREVM